MLASRYSRYGELAHSMSEESETAAVTPVATNGQPRHLFLQNAYARYWPELCNYLQARFGKGPPEPQDIAQHAFAQLAGLDEPTTIRNPRAFLYRVAINATIDHRRNSKRRDRLLATAVSPSLVAENNELEPERVSIGEEELAILHAAVMALPDRDRTFFLLNRLELVSFAEIARRTGLSASGVRLIVEQALESCQAALRAAQQQRARNRKPRNE